LHISTFLINPGTAKGIFNSAHRSEIMGILSWILGGNTESESHHETKGQDKAGENKPYVLENSDSYSLKELLYSDLSDRYGLGLVMKGAFGVEEYTPSELYDQVNSKTERKITESILKDLAEEGIIESFSEKAFEEIENYIIFGSYAGPNASFIDPDADSETTAKVYEPKIIRRFIREYLKKEGKKIDLNNEKHIAEDEVKRFFSKLNNYTEINIDIDRLKIEKTEESNIEDYSMEELSRKEMKDYVPSFKVELNDRNMQKFSIEAKFPSNDFFSQMNKFLKDIGSSKRLFKLKTYYGEPITFVYSPKEVKYLYSKTQINLKKVR